MSIDNRPIKNYPRNIRYRAPISSMQLNDLLDEVYYELVELLGFENSQGVTVTDGAIKTLSDSLSSDGESRWKFTVDDTSARLPMLGAGNISAGDIINTSVLVDYTENIFRIYLAKYLQ